MTSNSSENGHATWTVKVGLAQMLKGGVIMDVVTPDQAKIAEEAGACAVMALERVPSDIRSAGGVARMSDPAMIMAIKEAVSIPVMAKCRIGHYAEAKILEAIKDLENKIKNGFNNSKKNQKFWKNLEQEWSKNNHITQQWRPDINNKFVYFHDINNIKSSIPDFFLEKYRNVFLDY